jgi:transcriptional regulator with XRE-family HTH domain
MDQVAERLAELRERRALTLRELAEMSGVAADTINQIELGHRKARPSTLRKLARALEIDVQDFYAEPALPKVKAPRGAGRTLADFLNERCGHAYLALSREEIQTLFDQLESTEDEERKRRDLGLAINDEYNTFCNFPRNVTREERLAMRSMIRASIPDVAMKHTIALSESGLLPEYEEETKRIFEMRDRLLSDEGQTA